MTDELTVGDNTALTITLRDPDGTVIDLTGAAVEVTYVINETNSKTSIAQIESPETAGIITFRFPDAGLDEAGRMKVWFTITDALSNVYTSPDPLYFDINP